MRAPPVVLSILLSAAVPTAAQDAPAAIARKALCFHAKPKPACSAFLLTNFGAYVVAPVDSTHIPLRAVADWGFMANVRTRTAIGASVFLSADEAGLALGPAARYRRWMSSRTSFEFAVGKQLLGYGSGDIVPGSVFGLVRLSPAGWFVVTARPELLRRRMRRSDPSGSSYVRSWGRASIGLEVGEVPGLVLTPVGLFLMMLAGLRGINLIGGIGYE